MQNKSYDRYVELLRAAELQSYERTSARFIATAGVAASGSWVLNNPVTALMCTISSALIITVAVLTLEADDPVVKTSHSAQPVISRNQGETTSQAAAPSKPYTEVAQTLDRTGVSQLKVTMLEPAPKIAPVTDIVADESSITEVDLRDEVRSTGIASKKVDALFMVGIEPGRDQSRSHHLLVTLGMNGLPSIDKDHLPNFRVSAMLENGSFAFGVAGGLRSRNTQVTEFKGFKDTVFVVDDREMSSKIGQFGAADATGSYLEAGIVVACKVTGIFALDSFFPVLFIFAGLEGKDVVLEPSISLNWDFAEQFSVFGGASLRNYPFRAQPPGVRPLLGLTARL